jgi:transcriptional regulator with XRE-family HTH domain
MDAGTLVRRHRDSAGLTQGELAGRVGLSQGALSAIERGRRRPTIGTLERLLDELGLQLSIDAVDPVPAIDAAIDQAATRPVADRLRGRRLEGVEILERLAPAEPVLEGAAGAAAHGAPVPVQELDVVVTHGRARELADALYRLGSDRWSERWNQWGPAPLDPREPGAMRWRTLFGEVRVRLVDTPPEAIMVTIGDLTAAVRPLHEIECADRLTARVLARLRERLGAPQPVGPT